MQSLTNQKSNRIVSRAAAWWLMLALAVGCRERVVPEPVVTPAVASARADNSPSAPFDADLDLLLELMGDRLCLMPAVARYKWEHDRPIEDPERERSLVDRFVNDAKTRGIDADWSRRVIVAQIAAARRVQQDCFERWRTAAPGAGGPVLDLQTELRPRIERVTTELMKTLVRLEPHRNSAAFRQVFPARTDSLITREAISDEVRQLATSPWIESGERAEAAGKH